MTITIEHGPIVRNGRVVVKPAQLRFDAGARIGLIGLNGGGKSTWLHGIAGMLRGARVVVRAGDQTLSHLAFTSQHPTLPRWLTVGEALDILVMPRKSREELAHRWGIQTLLPRPTRQLSKGETQFIASIIALECESLLRCLDEPFAALDLKRRRELIDGIAAQRFRSSVTIVTAQVASDLFEVCTEILMIRDGTLTTLGSVSALSSREPINPRESFERQIVASLIET